MERERTTKTRVAPETRERAVRALLGKVKDPEIPVLTIEDLGILRDVCVSGDQVKITITPTYCGCPAMDVIAEDVRRTLRTAGYSRVRIATQLAPAWSTDWISDEGRRKLLEFGIAPPARCSETDDATPPDGIACPHCGSRRTRLASAFGSTACKAAYRCRDCDEPFEYFKCL